MNFTPAFPYAGVIAREILRRERETLPPVITLPRSAWRDETPRDEAPASPRSA